MKIDVIRDKKFCQFKSEILHFKKHPIYGASGIKFIFFSNSWSTVYVL